jgi:hypothetical protein
VFPGSQELHRSLSHSEEGSSQCLVRSPKSGFPVEIQVVLISRAGASHSPPGASLHRREGGEDHKRVGASHAPSHTYTEKIHLKSSVGCLSLGALYHKVDCQTCRNSNVEVTRIELCSLVLGWQQIVVGVIHQGWCAGSSPFCTRTIMAEIVQC